MVGVEDRRQRVFGTLAQTGELLGRYLSEERDTGRRLDACYAALVAAEAPSKRATKAKDTKKAPKSKKR